MKEHPMLFKTEMVQAIDDNRKTQTRRIMTERNCYHSVPFEHLDFSKIYKNGTGIKVHAKPEYDSIYGEGTIWRVTPRIQPGDLIWVRETWRRQSYSYADEDKNFSEYQYAATWPQNSLKNVLWKPSLFMPRGAARLLLKVKDVRIERLQDITEGDAIAEGIENIWGGEKGYRNYLSKDGAHCGAVFSYRSLWEKINGKESWDKNQLVCVYQFEKN